MNTLAVLLAYFWSALTSLLSLMIIGSAIGGILGLFVILVTLRIYQHHARKQRLANYKPVKL